MKPKPIWMQSPGRLEWNPQFQFKSFCMIDLTLYPMDRHKCRIGIESFYELKYVNLKTYGLEYNLTGFVKSKPRLVNPEWDVIKIESKNKQ